MDITRNWRLKTSRSQLMAARCPASGAVILPQQASAGSAMSGAVAVYHFEIETDRPRFSEVALDYARAAR